MEKPMQFSFLHGKNGFARVYLKVQLDTGLEIILSDQLSKRLYKIIKMIKTFCIAHRP